MKEEERLERKSFLLKYLTVPEKFLQKTIFEEQKVVPEYLQCAIDLDIM